MIEKEEGNTVGYIQIKDNRIDEKIAEGDLISAVTDESGVTTWILDTGFTILICDKTLTQYETEKSSNHKIEKKGK